MGFSEVVAIAVFLDSMILRAMSMTSTESRQASDRASLDLDVLKYLNVVKKRWLVIAAIMLGTVGLSALVAASRQVYYEADAKLLVKVDRTSSLTGFGEGIGELAPLVSAQNPLSTELAVMTSRPIIEQVIEQLNLKDNNGVRPSVQNLQAEIKAEILGGADVIQISYKSPNPELSAAVVNSLANTYIENNILENSSQSSEALLLIEQRLPESEAFVSESEAALRSFKENNRIVSLPDEAKSTVESLKSLETQVWATRVELDEATAVSNQIQNNLGLNVQQAMLISELSQAPAVQGVLQEMQALERQKSIELGFYTEEGPVVQNSQAQIDSLRNLLQQEMAIILDGNGQVSRRFWQIGDTKQVLITHLVEVETARLSLSQRLATLNSELETYTQRAETLPQLEQKQAELERRLEVARSSYQSLLERLQGLKTAESQVVRNARLIEPALVPEESTSDKKLILLIGGVMGMFLSTTAVGLLEIMDTYRQRQQQHGNIDEPDIVLLNQPETIDENHRITGSLNR